MLFNMLQMEIFAIDSQKLTNKEEIHHIVIPKIENPIENNNVTNIEISEEKYTINGIWTNDGNQLNNSNIFEKGKDYNLEFTISVNDGFKFSEDLEIIVGEKTIRRDDIDFSKEKIIFSYTYTVKPVVEIIENNSRDILVGSDEKFTDIQSAINYIYAQENKENWTITVKTGDYNRFTVLSGLNGLTVKSDYGAIVNIGVINGSVSPVEISAGYPDTDGVSVREANNVTFQGITFNMGSNKTAWHSSALSTHTESGKKSDILNIKDCTFNGQGTGYGVLLSSYITQFNVQNCVFNNVLEAIEIMCDNSALQGAEIKENIFNNCSFAIHGYFGGLQDNVGTLNITSNKISGNESIYSKIVVMDQLNKGSLKVNIAENNIENAVIGVVNLRENGETNDVLTQNSFGKNSFFVEAIEPGNIEFYSTYKAPNDSYGHWELRNKDGLENIDVIENVIKKANEEQSRTLSITGIPDGELIKTFTWFKDAIYWVTEQKPEPPIEPLPPTEQEWQKSKSKVAENLDENFISEITLSLPSAEKNLATDVVFVFDESSCFMEVREKVNNMLTQLYEKAKKTNATIKVGAVKFRGAVSEFALEELNETTKTKFIEFMENYISTSATNMSMGLLSGEKMLDDDTTVDNSRKYLILVSDGISYVWDNETTEEKENFGVNFSNADRPDIPILASPDGWDVKYGNKYVPENWIEHFKQVGKRITNTINEKSSIYERQIDISRNPFVMPNEQYRYVSTVDISLFKSNQIYQKIASKYKTYAVTAGNEEEMETYPYGPSFMEYLANGRQVSFDEIVKDIVYLVDKGSKIEDYIGYVADDYDFDFVNDENKISISIGDKIYKAEKIAKNKYGFKKNDKGYAYILSYFSGTFKEDEYFVWEINEPITNFNPVQLKYCVKLKNPKTQAGEYGQYDKDGSKKTTGLYTNNYAVLIPVDSNGVVGEKQFFDKPTVSYIVKESKPIDPEKPIPPVEPEPVKPNITSPLTADNTPIGKYVILMVSATIAIVIKLKNRKNNK